MKFYLSSYRIGNETKKLQSLIPENKKTAFISNALDAMENLERKKEKEQDDINDLKKFDLDVEQIDLRDYFNKKDDLAKKLSEFSIIWIRGGNAFILRQAMKFSGFDEIFKELVKKNNILYGGYSAGVCVLTPSLRGLEIVDDATARAYGDKTELIWDGLNILNYAVAPHYKSEGHPETEDIDKVVDYYIKNKILFKALTDGEVIIIE